MENHAQSDIRGRRLELCPTWFREVSLVSGNLPKIINQLVNKDNKELTICCYSYPIFEYNKKIIWKAKSNHILKMILC